MRNRKPQENINNVADFKDSEGNWVRSWVENFPDKLVQRVTRAGMLWNSINTRCKPNGPKQNRNPTYTGSENKFQSFNNFCEWCQSQPGYLNIDTNGRYWQLDKDIAEPSSNIYSEETCTFVPSSINLLFTFRSKSRGTDRTTPIGVHRESGSSNYIVRVEIGGVGKVIYRGSDMYEGHKIWQKYKASHIMRLAESRTDLGTKVRDGMLKHAVIIEQDIIQNRLTE